MKPNPFASLNHLTLPRAMLRFLLLGSYARTCAPAWAAPRRRDLGRLESSSEWNGSCDRCDTTDNRFRPLHSAGRGPCPVLSLRWRGRCIEAAREEKPMARMKNGLALGPAGGIALG